MSDFTGVVKAGVDPGGPNYDFQIKILICYLLAYIKAPLSLEQLSETFVMGGMVNYFELIKAVSELVDTGHLLKVKTNPLSVLESFKYPEAEMKLAEETSKTDYYEISEEGKQIAEIFEKDIPLSLREKSAKNAEEILKRLKAEAENRVSIRKTDDGYMVEVKIVDLGSNLLEMSLFSPTRDHAEFIKNNFLKDPSAFYKGVMNLLGGEIE